MKTNVLHWMKITHSGSSSNMKMNTQYRENLRNYKENLSINLMKLVLSILDF